MQNLGTEYMESDCRTYEYEKEMGKEKESINFWYRQAHCILNLDISCLIWEEGKKLTNHFN